MDQVMSPIIETIVPGTGNWRAWAKVTGASHVAWHDKRMSVESVSAQWNADIEQGWRLIFVAIEGKLIKKDGEPGLIGKNKAWGPDRLDQAPDYVREWLASIELPKTPSEVDALVQDAFNDGVDA